MMVKDSQKSLRKLEGLSYSIARIKDWQYCLVKRLMKKRYYYIPLEKAMLEDWQYRDSLIVDIDNSTVKEFEEKKSPNCILYTMKKSRNEDNSSIEILKGNKL